MQNKTEYNLVFFFGQLEHTFFYKYAHKFMSRTTRFYSFWPEDQPKSTGKTVFTSILEIASKLKSQYVVFLRINPGLLSEGKISDPSRPCDPKQDSLFFFIKLVFMTLAVLLSSTLFREFGNNQIFPW